MSADAESQDVDIDDSLDLDDFMPGENEDDTGNEDDISLDMNELDEEIGEDIDFEDEGLENSSNSTEEQKVDSDPISNSEATLEENKVAERNNQENQNVTKQQEKTEGKHNDLPKLDPQNLADNKEEKSQEEVAVKEEKNTASQELTTKQQEQQREEEEEKDIAKPTGNGEAEIEKSTTKESQKEKEDKVVYQEKTKVERPAPPSYEKKYFEKGENALFLTRDVCEEVFRNIKKISAHTESLDDLLSENIDHDEMESKQYDELISAFSDLQVQLLDLDAHIFSGDES